MSSPTGSGSAGRTAVVDASAVVDLLLGSALVRSTLAGTDPIAPELLDAEVLSAIARIARRGGLDPERGGLAIRQLARASIERVPIAPLLPAAWDLRHNFSPYDAIYVALARGLGCPLITTDRRLAGAPGVGVPVVVTGGDRQPG